MRVPLKRNQFRRGIAPLLFLEPFDEHTRSRRGKLFRVRLINQFLETFAARKYGPHFDLLSIYFNYSARLFAKRAMPTSLLQTVRAHKHAAFNDHRPDANDPVRPAAGAYAE